MDFAEMTQIRYLWIVALFTIVSINGKAQKKFNAQGSAQVKVENNMSREMAQDKASDLAIINAIESVLGTYVEQETNINIEDGTTNFRIIGNTKVKGEWLKTIKEEYSENTVESKNLNGDGTITEIWITCNTKGIVREIVKPTLTFEALTLNCPQSICRTTKYFNSEQFYLSFKTPSDGYLSVYIIESDIAYRLLPYSAMDKRYIDAVQVLADKDYVFFSQSKSHDYFSDFPTQLVDELIMTTDLDREYSQLYVIFSTELFSKPILNASVDLQSGSLPKSLSRKQFENWINNNRIYNPKFNYEITNLEIVKK